MIVVSKSELASRLDPRTHQIGVAVFTTASLACDIAGSAEVLVAARFAQGLGAAVMASAILALIVVEFPDAAGRATATRSTHWSPSPRSLWGS
jgi:MFS family permease